MKSRPATTQTRLRRLLVRSRVFVYVGLVLVVAYHAWRYDLVSLPAGGTSPLTDVPPGARLIVDLHFGALATGDAVLYRDGESLLLGRVEAPPPSAPEHVHEACAEGALWILKDRPQVPGNDSTRLGPIPRADVGGRVAGVLPW